MFTIKNLIKPTKSNIIFQEISKNIWKPLIILDHTFKYNKHSKDHYYNLIMKKMKYWDSLSINSRLVIIISFQIIPRIILVTFLLLDTFYFNKLEIFYKIVLVGLLPFVFRYIQYSFSDFYAYLIIQLTDKYEKVQIFEKGYSYDISHIGKTGAVWHYEWVAINEYVEIIYENFFESNATGIIYHEYVGQPYCKNEIYTKYEQEFNKPISTWTIEDRKEVNKLFEELIPQILNLKLTLDNFQVLKKREVIIWAKVGIYTIYLTCWCYILFISYYNYPIELKMFKNLIINIMSYLVIADGEDPFIGISYSINENLITIENVKNLIINIKNVILNKIKNDNLS